MALIDMTGQRFGRLTVLERAENYQYDTGAGWYSTKAVWRCRCDCGAETVVIGSNLRRGATRSCGCLRSEQMKERNARKRELKKYGLTMESRK